MDPAKTARNWPIFAGSTLEIESTKSHLRNLQKLWLVADFVEVILSILFRVWILRKMVETGRFSQDPRTIIESTKSPTDEIEKSQPLYVHDLVIKEWIE